MFTTKRFFLLTYIIFVALTHQLHAGVVTWDDEANDKVWSNPINWDGDLLPTSTDDVIIPSGFTVTINSNATIQSLSLMGTLSIEASAQLDVFVGVPNGVTIQGGDLTVEGTLNIRLSDTYGIEISSLGNINIKGNLIIDQIGNTGIYIDFNSTLITQFGAVVNVSDVSTGINCNFGNVTNQGRIDISDNNGTNGAGVAVGNSGVFNNSNGGRLNISNFTTAALAAGILNRNQFTNSGSIDISEIASRAVDNDTGNFNNIGTLVINSNLGDGIYNHSTSTFTNSVGAEINISGMTQNGRSCIWGGGLSFDNAGLISLTSFGSRGIQCSAVNGLSNTGNITVITESCGEVISNISSFVNELGGIISITINNAFQIIGNLNSFKNHGQLSIGIEDSDILIASGSSSINTEFINTGSLLMTGGAGGIMLGITGGAGATYTNTGLIDMSYNNLQATGINVTSGVHFINDTSGIINLSYGPTSIGDPIQLSTGGILTNDGQLTAQEF